MSGLTLIYNVFFILVFILYIFYREQKRKILLYIILVFKSRINIREAKYVGATALKRQDTA